MRRAAFIRSLSPNANAKLAIAAISSPDVTLPETVRYPISVVSAAMVTPSAAIAVRVAAQAAYRAAARAHPTNGIAAKAEAAANSAAARATNAATAISPASAAKSRGMNILTSCCLQMKPAKSKPVPSTTWSAGQSFNLILWASLQPCMFCPFAKGRISTCRKCRLGFATKLAKLVAVRLMLKSSHTWSDRVSCNLKAGTVFTTSE